MEKNAGRVPQGMSYQLPTEAQWEYACRAGTTTKYSWGDDINPKLAYYTDSGPKKPTAVGSYRPNPWGFFDMHGNVYEWTADWYQAAYPTGNPVVDPTGPASGSSGVLRGGSWYDDGAGLRSARRLSYHLGNPTVEIFGSVLVSKKARNKEASKVWIRGGAGPNEPNDD
jgi:formylglycine-generating enzyme required for sulfatase activity